MLAANPQRTSWTPEEVRCDLNVLWYRPIQPYIPYKVEPIAANGKIYVSTASGLYAINATTGNVDWVYPTELPLGNSPTIARVNGTAIAYVGGFDDKIHAIDATTGQDIAGYTPYVAMAGFETNPLVINDSYTGNATVILAGNRDGYFYALDAVTGALKWKYQTNGAILFSAAYKNGVVYFASQDNNAYALNVATGALIWKTGGFPGQGFYSFWPVIYTDKVSGKDYVIFSGSENYRFSEINLQALEGQYFFPSCFTSSSCPWGTPIGPESVAPNDGYWTPGTDLIDASKISTYYENYPSRRSVFVLNSTNGQEYTFDSNGNGIMEYAPFTWSGTTHSGDKYPPIINGIDGIYYQDTAYASAPSIVRGDVVGWKFGTHFVSRVVDGSYAHAVDEPMTYSSGGKLIYWSLCCDREAGSYDVTIPYGQPNRAWQYYDSGGRNLNNLISAAYEPEYYDAQSTYDWRFFGSNNGSYGKHGSTQSPPIPYLGKLYMLRGNALLAFSPTATSVTSLPMANTIAAQSTTPPPTTSDLTQRLTNEVQKMLAAGPLRPGYHPSSIADQYGEGWYGPDQEFGEIFDYFQNPSDTVVTLIQALPYLSPSLQSQVKTYIQSNYGPGSQYDLTKIVHIGWGTGAARDFFTIPADDFAFFGQPYRPPLNPSTTPICGSCGYWHNFPPYNFYAAWKYAQVFGNAKSIFDSMSSKLESPPSDSYLTANPYMLNLYIAGYNGYLQLQQLAGYAPSATVQTTYSHLLNLRVTGFSKDVPWTGFDYHRTLSISRNFMFLTPELGAYLNQNASAQVQGAISEYSTIAPYWFVSGFDDTYGEGTTRQLYDYPALFQAKAYILKDPYTDLVKYLDAPAFYRGDLFYIQNLVAALGAP